MEKLKFSERCIFERYEGKVLLLNRETSHKILISENCFNIIVNSIDMGYSINQIINNMADEDDSKFIEKLLSVLIHRKFLVNEELTCIKLQTITFLLTNRCNLKCKHCCASAVDNHSEDILDKATVMKIINKLVACNVETIIFSGGEPLIRNDFMDILEETRRKFKGKIGLMTNGVLINKQNITQLVTNIDEFNISIDGCDEDSCSTIRGKGVFNKVMETISLLKKYTDKIYLSMVMTPQNRKLKSQFLEMNKQLGTLPILRDFVVGERAIENYDHWGSKEEIDIAAYQMENNIDDISFLSCGGIFHELAIRHDGMMVPCPLMSDDEFILADIQNVKNLQSFLQYDNLKLLSGFINFMRYFPENFDYCKTCPVNQHCWYCPHDIYNAYKYGRNMSIKCELKKNILKKIVWKEE